MAQACEGEATTSLEEVERRKYERVWGIDGYAKTSPAFHRYFDVVLRETEKFNSVIEFGCGAGYALDWIKRERKVDVLGVDIASNCLRVDVPFLKANIWEPMPCSAEVGYCVDVLEHIPTEKVEQTIQCIMECVPRCLFIACMLPDNGKHTGGEPLHLTVKNQAWWKNKAMRNGKLESFRSDARSSIFVLTR